MRVSQHLLMAYRYRIAKIITFNSQSIFIEYIVNLYSVFRNNVLGLLEKEVTI